MGLGFAQRERRAETLPVGETGGCKGQGGRGGGGSPDLHKRMSVMTDVLNVASARKVGETTPDGAGLPALHPCPRQGAAPPSSPPGVSVSGSRARGPDQDVQSRETGDPCIL